MTRLIWGPLRYSPGAGVYLGKRCTLQVETMQRNTCLPHAGNLIMQARSRLGPRAIGQRSFACVSLSCVLLALVSCAADSINDRREGQLIVCHKGKHTMAVSNADSFLHLDHGDTLGPCPEQK